MEVRRYTLFALVFPAILAVGPLLPPPNLPDPSSLPSSTETPRLEPAFEAPAEPEVQPPEEPCDEEGGRRAEA